MAFGELRFEGSMVEQRAMCGGPRGLGRRRTRTVSQPRRLPLTDEVAADGVSAQEAPTSSRSRRARTPMRSRRRWLLVCSTQADAGAGMQQADAAAEGGAHAAAGALEATANMGGEHTPAAEGGTPRHYLRLWEQESSGAGEQRQLTEVGSRQGLWNSRRARKTADLVYSEYLAGATAEGAAVGGGELPARPHRPARGRSGGNRRVGR